MFGRESDSDEQSGLLRNGKRYKRAFGSYILGQNSDYTSLSQEESESEEIPFVITPQRRSVIPEIPSQSESNPSQSNPVTGQSPVSSPFLFHPPVTSPPPRRPPPPPPPPPSF